MSIARLVARFAGFMGIPAGGGFAARFMSAVAPGVAPGFTPGFTIVGQIGAFVTAAVALVPAGSRVIPAVMARMGAGGFARFPFRAGPFMRSPFVRGPFMVSRVGATCRTRRMRRFIMLRMFRIAAAAFVIQFTQRPFRAGVNPAAAFARRAFMAPFPLARRVDAAVPGRAFTMTTTALAVSAARRRVAAVFTAVGAAQGR